MSKSAFITARIEPKLKARASRVLAKVGVSTTDAITMFLRQVVLRGGMPFDVRVPNSATGKAIEELEAGKGESLHDRTQDIFNGVVRPRKHLRNVSPVRQVHKCHRKLQRKLRRNPPTPVQLAVPPSAMPPVPPRE